MVLLRSGWLQDRLRDNNVDTRIVCSNHSWDIGLVFKLAKCARDFATDLIHAHLPGANLYSCLAGAITGIPVITTYHGELVLPGSSEKYDRIKHFLARTLAKRIVVVADFLTKDFVEVARFPREKIEVIHNGVAVSSAIERHVDHKFRSSLGLAPEDLVVGIVANLRPAKGYEYFLAAAKLICQEMPGVKFLIAGEGEGEIKRKMLSTIESLGLGDSIRILGFRSDVPKLLRAFDIFVLSSISEGLPLCVAEAMAAARPVVATRVGGLPEVVRDGHNGYLVEPGDPRALAERTLHLLRNRELRLSMGEAGHRIALSRFSLEAMISRYETLYESLDK